MTVTQLGLAYSIQQFLENKTSIPSHIKYDGFELPKEKPFLIVELSQNNNQQLSKLRESINTTFRFQVGLYADSEWGKSAAQENIRNLFLFEEIPYYNDDGVLTDSVFCIESDFNETPLPADDLSDKTNRHRVFFTIEVNYVFNKRRNN